VEIVLKFVFSPSSLDTPASNLVDHQMNTVKSFFSNDIEFRLIRKKGLFPYEYLDSASRLEETSIAPRETFYSNLTEMECTLEEYDHALKVWSHFSCSTLKDYTSLQKKIDEISHEGDLGLPVRHIFLIKKKALKIFCIIQLFLRCKKPFWAPFFSN